MEKHNVNEIAAAFVATCKQRQNDANTNSAINEGEARKDTARKLDNVLRGFNATCKVLNDYCTNISEADKARKDSFYCFYSLNEIAGKDAKQVKAFIAENLQQITDENGCLCAAVPASILATLTREAKEAREAAATTAKSRSVPQILKDEAKKAVKAAADAREAVTNSKAALIQAQNVVAKADEANKAEAEAEAAKIAAKVDELSKTAIEAEAAAKVANEAAKATNASNIMQQRAKAAEKLLNKTRNALEAATIEAGFKPFIDKNGLFCGALLPVVRWSPASLANYIRKAAKAAAATAKKNTKEAA